MLTDNQTLWPEDRSWPEVVKSAAWQHERGKDTGHLHTQAYITVKQPKTELQIRELFPGAHVELAWATRVACIRYVMKEDTRVAGPFSYGMELTNKGHNDDGRAPRGFLRLCAFCEKSTTTLAISKRVIEWYVEQDLCFPPERRIIDLVTSVMAHNAFTTRRACFDAWRDGWAQHLCRFILYRSEDYLTPEHAFNREQAQASDTESNTPQGSPEDESVC